MVVEQLKQYKIATLSFSDRGQRESNQDRILFSPLHDGIYLLGIIDGMGGYNNGEVAAELAKKSFLEYLSASIDDINEKVVIDSFIKAHDTIISELDESGATVAIVLIKNDKVHIFWTGDVKVFLKTGDTEFISKDHTLLNLIREPDLTIKIDETPRLKNTVVKSLGGKSNSYVPDFVSFDLSDDFFGFICSDGVHQLFSDRELLQALYKSHEQNSLEDIINRCKENSADNFSGVFFCSSGLLFH